MKELEKTKRISVAAVLTILIVFIAVLSYQRPKHNYDVTLNDAMASVMNTSYFTAVDSIDPASTIIDIRSSIEFERGHLDNAIHMYAPELLSDENTEILETFKNDNTELVLYGSEPHEAILSYQILTQLGYTNVKVLPIRIFYKQTEMVVKSVKTEELNVNIQAFIDESVKKAAAKPKPKKVVAPPPKKVVPKKKKKKMPLEGGC